MVEQPEYFETIKTYTVRGYNPDYGDERQCLCGHPYYRHFDSYDNNAPVGCKYCTCDYFVSAVEVRNIIESTSNIIRNILTDSQLDTKTSCGITLRNWSNFVDKIVKKLNQTIEKENECL